MRIALLVLSFTAAAVRAETEEPEALHGGLSLGLGTAYDGLGVRAEIGSNHLGLFGGIGLLPLAIGGDATIASGPIGFSAGIRWYQRVRACSCR